MKYLGWFILTIGLIALAAFFPLIIIAYIIALGAWLADR